MTPHPLSPRADCARHVSIQARLMTAASAVFGLWQFAWLAREADHIEAVLPTPWSVEFWMAVWAVVAVTGLVAAVTACDRPVRVALAALAVAEVMGATVVLGNDLPLQDQFWTFGSSVTVAVVCGVLLSGPLRSGVGR